ncbi:MAG: nucleotidyltransferase family protein [Sedimentisphaerales bacterium]|nr:nucleotidyltransferase family protein [Sedimentisphaerales bacterium]
MNSQLNPDREQIGAFCRRHHIRKLSVFGSALRGDFSPESDVDILIEFEANHIPGFFKLAEMADELSPLFAGRKIDLLTPEDISRYFRDKVITQAEVQYAEN